MNLVDVNNWSVINSNSTELVWNYWLSRHLEILDWFQSF